MAEVTRAAAQTTAEGIRDETIENANTPTRVGGHMVNVVQSVVWNQKGTAAARPVSSTIVGDRYFATDTGILSVWNGSVWKEFPVSPLTTKGDIWVRDNASDARLPIGTDGQMIVADSAESTGLKYVTRTLTAGAGLTGLGDLSADRTVNVGANADGSIVANADDIQVGILATDAQHGVRGGGTQHAVAVAAGAAGFMSGADKSKLDGIAASAAAVTSTPPVNVTKAAAAVGVGTTAARHDHKHDVTTAAPVNVTKAANSEGTSTSLARADHKHDVTTAAPVAVGSANAEGNATSLARSNHVHAPGDRIELGSSQIRIVNTGGGVVTLNVPGDSITTFRLLPIANGIGAGANVWIYGADGSTDGGDVGLIAGAGGTGPHGTAFLREQSNTYGVDVEPDGSAVNINTSDATGAIWSTNGFTQSVAADGSSTTFETTDGSARVWSQGGVTQHEETSVHPSTAAGETAYYTLIGHATDPDGYYKRLASDGLTILIADDGGI